MPEERKSKPGYSRSISRALLINRHIDGRVPLIGVGSIHTPDEALRTCQAGIPLIALGREILMEPDWVQKVQEGRENQVKTILPKEAREELVIPEGMWEAMLSRKGWLPVV